ncbi:hypothetical protein BYT27DRAFT_7219332 [Phlegmacium glaucopus]|nr:hypothetical protein BYT27DRAFT_7219332 [Phlegmacium glaucopus]
MSVYVDSSTTPHIRLNSFHSSPPSQVTYRKAMNKIWSKIKKVTYSNDHNFIVRYMPSQVHKNAHLKFTTLLAIALLLNLGRRMKEADAGVWPTASNSDLPSVVLEVGSLESLMQLKIDVKLWLEHTQEVREACMVWAQPCIYQRGNLPIGNLPTVPHGARLSSKKGSSK